MGDANPIRVGAFRVSCQTVGSGEHWVFRHRFIAASTHGVVAAIYTTGYSIQQDGSERDSTLLPHGEWEPAWMVARNPLDEERDAALMVSMGLGPDGAEG